MSTRPSDSHRFASNYVATPGLSRLSELRSPLTLLQYFVGCFGIVTSTAWTLQNRGAKYWHESWEHKTHLLQKRVLGTDLFSNREQ